MDKNKLAVVHIVKKELGMSDAKYREILRSVAGVESAKDLDEANFRKLMNYFVRSSHYRVNLFGLTIRQKMLINYLAQQMGWDGGHLNNFIHKYYHDRSLETLTRKEAIKLIESLKKVRARRQEAITKAIGEEE
jgi:hypothetical protein